MQPGTTIKINAQPNGAHDHLTGLRGTIAATQPSTGTGFVNVTLRGIGTVRVWHSRLTVA